MLSAELAEDMAAARSGGTPPQQKKRRVHKKCIHGRALARCVACGGKKRATNRCSDHNEKYCVSCGMVQPKKYVPKKCPHGRQSDQCTACGGTKKVAHRCNDHSKFNCVECGAAPPKKCLHGRRKRQCVECSGCPHNRRKDHCVECTGCPHGKRQYTCVPCNGKGICEHQLVRQYCVECNGVSICEHKIKRMYCTECGGSRVCSSCYMVTVHRTGELCKTCQPVANKNARVTEASVAGHLKQWSDDLKIPIYSFWNKQVTGSNPTVCGAMRPDFIWELATHVVVLEVDESQHSHYNPKCEFERMCNLSGSFGMPMVMLRYNPDAFKISGMTRTILKTRRLPILLQRLQHALTTPPPVLITVEYLYYSRIQPSADNPLIGHFSFSEQQCMAKWIDAIGSRWDSLTLAEAVELAEDATSMGE